MTGHRGRPLKVRIRADLFTLVAEWIPRIAYALVALLVGYGLIHSGAFMPSLPPELR